MATPIKDLQVDESRGYIILVVQSVFLAVALPLMVLRLYVRKFIVPELGWDDLFMVVATVPPNPLRLQNHSLMMLSSSWP